MDTKESKHSGSKEVLPTHTNLQAREVLLNGKSRSFSRLAKSFVLPFLALYIFSPGSLGLPCFNFASTLGVCKPAGAPPASHSVTVTIKEPEDSKMGTVKWWKCPEEGHLPGSECGTIVVPKDYFNPSAGTATIALGRVRAVGERKGMVLVNPGGPGGSGKGFAVVRGDMVQRLLGGAAFDIVGFDPRGIGETTPHLRCFDVEQDGSFGDLTAHTPLEEGYLTTSKEELLQQLITTDGVWKTAMELCKERMGEELRYMGTSTVVRDMDFITKALEGDDALINFWGGSYGSILGQYLVNMLPDRLGRVVIDGIADAEAWANLPPHLWYRNWLSSTEGAYQTFLDACVKYGPERCALAGEPYGSSPASIRARIDEVREQLHARPLPVPHGNKPGLLKAGMVDIFLLGTLQRPIQYREAAIALKELLATPPNPLKLYNSVIGGAGPNIRDMERSGVSCNDQMLGYGREKEPTPEEVTDELWSVINEVTELTMAVIPSEKDGGCGYWPVAPPERFTGPWNATLRNPILIHSNTDDPVTPIWSGRKVNKLLGDKQSRLAIQHGPGHCSIAVFSACTVNITRAYFQDGILPPPNHLCEPETELFPLPEEENAFVSAMDVETREMWEAVRAVDEGIWEARGGRWF
ncbi:hypothetical protein BT69DRAFT_159775 [Atractiella rhizophila]|nr:hypothetical protein BT69DRAFT_159775 [Atractiella rhizophila]